MSIQKRKIPRIRILGGNLRGIYSIFRYLLTSNATIGPAKYPDVNAHP